MDRFISQNDSAARIVETKLQVADIEHYSPSTMLLTYEQAAKLLQLGARTVRRLVERGELPAVRYGRTVRLDRRDLLTWIDRKK